MGLVLPGHLSTMELHPTLEERVKAGQIGNTRALRIQQLMAQGLAPKMSKDDQGILWYGKRLFVPRQRELKGLTLKEAHESAYFIHPGGIKMYQDLEQRYWWPCMKRDIAMYIACCDVCQ